MRSTWLSILPTEEPRSTHISLFQEPNAQILPLTFPLKCICFTLSQEGSLELWSGQCFGGEGAVGALKSDLSGDPPNHTQVHTKCTLYCRTQTHLRKMAMLVQGMWRGRRPQCTKEWKYTSRAYFGKNSRPHFINKKQ